MLSVKKQAAFTFVLILLGLSSSGGLAFDAEPYQTWDEWTSFDVEAYTMAEGPGPWEDCGLQYYYYVPNSTYSWFWSYSGWEPGDIIGAWFRIGDQGTGGFDQCHPRDCSVLEGLQVLDFAGYGTVYPGLFTVMFDVYCADETLEPRLCVWRSGPVETGFGWNYIDVGPTVYLDQCWESWQEFPRIIVTMTMIGTYGVYPRVGFDNVSTPVEMGCEMHDCSCLPAAYPRDGFDGDEPRVHSGYVGRHPFEYWPPRPFPDGKHLVDPSGMTWFGYVEAAWRVYLTCYGPCLRGSTHPTSWGRIKAMYR